MLSHTCNSPFLPLTLLVWWCRLSDDLNTSTPPLLIVKINLFHRWYQYHYSLMAVSAGISCTFSLPRKSTFEGRPLLLGQSINDIELTIINSNILNNKWNYRCLCLSSCISVSHLVSPISYVLLFYDLSVSFDCVCMICNVTCVCSL